jgi:hypothetical protein
MADGPRVADVIPQSLIGRVIGIYEAASSAKGGVGPMKWETRDLDCAKIRLH